VTAATPEVLPIVLLGQAQQRELELRVAEVIGDWQRRWTMHATRPRVQICRGSDAPSVRLGRMGTWFHARRDAQLVLHTHVPCELAAHLIGVAPAPSIDTQAPVASTLVDTLAHSICTHLIQACCTRSGAVSVSAGEPPAQAWGWLRALIDIDGCELILELSPVMVEKWLKHSMPAAADALVRRRAAIGEARVELEALLGTTEVTLADLAVLAPGDVIVFEQVLQAASELRTRVGSRIGPINLGRAGDARAVSLTGESKR
jgi:hypothetical protein